MLLSNNSISILIYFYFILIELLTGQELPGPAIDDFYFPLHLRLQLQKKRHYLDLILERTAMSSNKSTTIK